MPNFAQSELNSDVAALVSGTFSAADFLLIANMAVKTVISEIDIRSMMRKTALSPNLFDDVFEYTCPSTLKRDRIIDIKPQIKRGRFDRWTLVPQEEFDRMKTEGQTDSFGDPVDIGSSEWLGANLVAISRDDFTNKLLLSRPMDDDEVTIDGLNALDSWVLFGDGENLTKDADNYVKGSACINFDISSAGGTTAGVQHTSLDTFDVTEYKTAGSIFVHAYITSATNLTNYIIRVGSSSSAYYSITITTNNEGASFYAGWNLLRFDFVNKSTTGTPDDDACDYCVLYMTKDAAKVSETDYRFDNIVMKIGDHYDVIYYGKYGWQSSAGTYLEDATATTDLLNVDTDEYELIRTKTCELMEIHLKHPIRAKEFKKDYKEAKAEYIFNNPSEALLLTQTYHTL